MATLQISDISDSVAQLYTNASAEEQRQLARVVEEIIVLLNRAKTPTPELTSSPVNDKPRRNPFDTSFKPIKLRGEGPTGSEMVIQARR
jgi:hypothetical protein